MSLSECLIAGFILTMSAAAIARLQLQWQQQLTYLKQSHEIRCQHHKTIWSIYTTALALSDPHYENILVTANHETWLADALVASNNSVSRVRTQLDHSAFSVETQRLTSKSTSAADSDATYITLLSVIPDDVGEVQHKTVYLITRSPSAPYPEKLSFTPLQPGL